MNSWFYRSLLIPPKPLYKKVFVISLMFLYVLVGYGAYDDYGISSDENLQRKHGLVSMKYLLDLVGWQELTEHSRFTNIPNLSSYEHKSYGVIFHLPLIALEIIFDLDRNSEELWKFRHLYTFIFFFIGSIFFYATLNLLYGYKLAIIGWLMLIISPRIFAHSFYNVKDTIFLASMCFFIFAALRFWKTQTLSNASILALACAISINVRLAGVLLLFSLFLVMMIDWLFKKEWPKSKEIFILFFFGLLTSVLTLAFYPAFWSEDLGFLIENFWLATNYDKWNGTTIFMGKLIRGSMTPWHYTPVWMLVTIPLSYIFLFLFGMFYFSKVLTKSKSLYMGWFCLREQFFFFLLLFLPIFLVIIFNSTLYGSWRHLFFIYPAFLVVAVSGLKQLLILKVKSLNSPPIFVFYTAVLVAVIGHMAFTAIWMLRNHPNQQVYFNALAAPKAAIKFDRDYWGLSARAGLEFVLRNDDRSYIKISGRHVAQNLSIISSHDKSRIKVVSENNLPDYYIETYRNIIGQKPVNSSLIPIYNLQVDDFTIMTVFRSENISAPTLEK